MAKVGRNGNYYAVEFAGETVRLCRFRVAGERVAVGECETRPADGFDFSRIRGGGERSRPGGVRVLCAVPRSEVFLKPFTLPRSDGMDIGKVAALKLEQSVAGLDSGETLWGYTETPVENGAKRTAVLAAAISRSYVEGLLERHFPDSERPEVVECGALAAVRAHLAVRARPVRCEVVADCASDGLSLFVLKGGVIESAHFVPADQPLSEAVNEIFRLVLFMRSKREGAEVERVVCLGGPEAGDLVAALRERLEIPVADRIEQAPAWIENAGALPDGWEREWHRVIGLIELARRGGTEAINFVAGERPSVAARPLLPALEQVGTPVLAVAFAALLAVGFFTQRAFSHRRERLMSQVIERGRTIGADLQRSEKVLAILKRYRTERFSLAKVFFELAKLAPPGVTLSSLTLNPDGSVSVTGRCKRYTDGQEFARKLNESGFFTSAVTSSLRRERSGIVFKTTFSLTPTARRTAR